MREHWASWLVTSTVQFGLLVWLLSADVRGLGLVAAIIGGVAVSLLIKLGMNRLLRDHP